MEVVGGPPRVGEVRRRSSHVRARKVEAWVVPTPKDVGPEKTFLSTDGHPPNQGRRGVGRDREG